MLFYLGTHQPSWLGELDVPLFVSRRTLSKLHVLPRARRRWALDSGGFSELSLFGRWTVTPAQYAAEVRQYRDEIGKLDWAAIQDWMCEPEIIAKTGLTVRDHQARTVRSYCELQALAPDLPWLPVLQGQTLDDYQTHARLYAEAGFKLRKAPAVGVGSICRRQHTEEVEVLLRRLSRRFRIHGFGLKTRGLSRVADVLDSADSLAWSFTARYAPPLPGCTHRTCANCSRYAVAWRERLLETVKNPG